MHFMKINCHRFSNQGINQDLLSWMDKEADRLHITIGGRQGGMVFDEMAIQVSH